MINVPGKTASSIKVALVDDHALLRQSVKLFIGSHAKDCVVTLQAENGRVLVDQLANLPLEQLPDVIVLDINMPGMDGYATLQWLKRYSPEIKIIMLSMSSDDHTIIRCLRLGAKAYLMKNVDGDELIKTIRMVNEQGHYYSQLVAGLAVASLQEDAENYSQPKTSSVLTKKEEEFLQLICTELTYKEIADLMYISPRTADVYRDRLFEKLNVKTRVGLALYAAKNNLIKI
jgi:two-component system invasion response regulator UvrY